MSCLGEPPDSQPSWCDELVGWVEDWLMWEPIFFGVLYFLPIATAGGLLYYIMLSLILYHGEHR